MDLAIPPAGAFRFNPDESVPHRPGPAFELCKLDGGEAISGSLVALAMMAVTLSAALVTMVMASTFIAPPWLKALYRRS